MRTKEIIMPNIQFGNTNIPYSLTCKPNKKNISIIVEQEKGVRIIAPTQVDKEQIEEIISRKASWILRKQREIAEICPTSPSKEFLSGEKLPYLGRQYRLKVFRDAQIKEVEFQFHQGKFVAKVPEDFTSLKQVNTLRELFLNWCLLHGKQKMKERLHFYSDRLGLKYRSFSCKERKTKWGSCSVNGDIVIHPNIIFAPLSIIDYLLVHELAHLKHFNHTKDFWNYVQLILPDYKNRKEWLRVNGPTLKV